MKTIIKKLYYGTLNPDNIVLNDDNEYRNLNEQIVKLMEIIEREIGEDKFKKITELMELTTESNALETENAFIYGFKYGAIMMLEILVD